MVQLSHPSMTTGKAIALTRRTFVGKVMSLLFNMLSRLVITFLPRSKRLLISWLQSPSAVILEPPKIKSVFPLFPHLFPYIVSFFFLGWGLLGSTLSNIQICNTILLTIINMPYFIFPRLTVSCKLEISFHIFCSPFNHHFCQPPTCPLILLKLF